MFGGLESAKKYPASPKRHFDLEKTLVDSVILESLNDLGPQFRVINGLRDRLVGKLGQLGESGDDDCDDVVLGGVGVKADVFNDGASLENGFNLSHQGYY